MKKILSTLLAVVLVVLFSIFGGPGEEAVQPEIQQQIQIIETEVPAAAAPEETEAQPQAPPETVLKIVVGESYTTKEDVALYIHLYNRLPSNFITKSEARQYGWKSGSLEKYAKGKCIGGDRFYNNEGLLPRNYTYYECDIDTLGSYGGRGAKRIVFTYTGLVYYTNDHYESFTLLYGEP